MRNLLILLETFYVWWVTSLLCFQILFLSLDSLIIICQDVDVLKFILLGFCWDSWCVDSSLMKSGRFSAIISSIPLFDTFSLSFPLGLPPHIGGTLDGVLQVLGSLHFSLCFFISAAQIGQSWLIISISLIILSVQICYRNSLYIFHIDYCNFQLKNFHLVSSFYNFHLILHSLYMLRHSYAGFLQFIVYDFLQLFRYT